jgi:hypothetical protein
MRFSHPENVPRMIFTIKSDYSPKQHYPVCFCNEDAVYFGTEFLNIIWVLLTWSLLLSFHRRVPK